MDFHTRTPALDYRKQGSIVSPILANIYLHELDIYVEKLKSNYDKGVV